jgi:hypothetical protein
MASNRTLWHTRQTIVNKGARRPCYSEFHSGSIVLELWYPGIRRSFGNHCNRWTFQTLGVRSTGYIHLGTAEGSDARPKANVRLIKQLVECLHWCDYITLLRIGMFFFSDMPVYASICMQVWYIFLNEFCHVICQDKLDGINRWLTRQPANFCKQIDGVDEIWINMIMYDSMTIHVCFLLKTCLTVWLWQDSLTCTHVQEDIVKRFDGKGMAVVGFEIDQVRRTDKGISAETWNSLWHC